ncbi:phosphopentomutase [Vibrio sp. ES.051]|uniref:phosphopentomutase n=1 Tax=Vibrio sp. ES.051 TaxID=1761909 RepID=UPI000BF90273|nr:phosphopentomutase [Vibrio sp. ES.051]PFG58344.1 phosphopentomutase [Vibrio sp. ES.051]
MGRFIVVVLDGFGIGEMADVSMTRPNDVGAHTAGKLIKEFTNCSLPTIEGLGLTHLVDASASGESKYKPVYGRANLMHEGADTFMGHQEIMGTLPKSPLVIPFQHALPKIKQALFNNYFRVQEVTQNGLSALLVEDAVVVGDNLEADLGQVYNLTANLSAVTFEKLLSIAKVVRSANEVGRNIAFGGYLDTSSAMLEAIETKSINGVPTYIGVNSPKSGVYERGFQVQHIGYGVDHETQVPQQLKSINIPTYLYGKVADIVSNSSGVNYQSMVDTNLLFDKLFADISRHTTGFFCLNVQETDLAGHQQNSQQYWNILSKADKRIAQIIDAMSNDDYLIVMADHGNDPYIGHSKHTREQVPLLIHNKKLTQTKDIGTRKTLSDVGATVCDYFSAPMPENGKSFLTQLNTLT